MKYLLRGKVYPKPFHFYKGYRGVERDSLPDFLKEIDKTDLFNKYIDILFFPTENINKEEELSTYKDIVDLSSQNEKFEVIAVLDVNEELPFEFFLGHEVIFQKNHDNSALVYFLREIGSDANSLREKYLHKLNDSYLFQNIIDAKQFVKEVESVIEKSEDKDNWEDYHDEIKIIKIFSIYT